MNIKVNCNLLEEQITMCDIYSDNASNEHERELFDGIANLLSGILFSLEHNEIIDISNCAIE